MPVCGNLLLKECVLDIWELWLEFSPLHHQWMALVLHLTRKILTDIDPVDISKSRRGWSSQNTSGWKGCGGGFDIRSSHSLILLRSNGVSTSSKYDGLRIQRWANPKKSTKKYFWLSEDHDSNYSFKHQKGKKNSVKQSQNQDRTPELKKTIYGINERKETKGRMWYMLRGNKNNKHWWWSRTDQMYCWLLLAELGTRPPYLAPWSAAKLPDLG